MEIYVLFCGTDFPDTLQFRTGSPSSGGSAYSYIPKLIYDKYEKFKVSGTGAVAYVYGTTSGTRKITLNKVYNVSDYPVVNWFGYGIDISGNTANAYLTLTKNT